MVVLFSDIDGTVTNKFTHAFEGTDIYIRRVREAGIKFIFVSSKTFSEIYYIQQQLNFQEIFIFENGSGIAFPYNQYPQLEKNNKCYKALDFLIYPLAPANIHFQDWLHTLEKLVNEPVEKITGNNIEKIAALTSLSPEALKRAQDRKYTETYLSENVAGISLEVINTKLKPYNGFAEKGSRFITVAYTDTSKGNAISALSHLLSSQFTSMETISVGDGLNDISMFKATNTCFYLTNGNVPEEIRDFCQTIQPAGPKGFIKVCMKLLNM